MNPATDSKTKSLHQSVRRNTVILAMGLVVMATAVYLPTLWHDFVNYDDNHYITENSNVQNGLTLDGVKWAFSTFAVSNWHPLTWMSHMTDVQIWGLRASGHHLTNVILHALNTLLLFMILHRMTSAMWRSALVAAAFAVHPLHVESVAWISERKDVLSTFLGLLAMWTYIGWVKTPSLGRYALIMLWFALSLMAKPMLVTLPCVLLLLDVWPLNRMTSTGAMRLVIEKLPLFALSAASCVMTILAQRSAMVSLEHVSVVQRIFNVTVGYGVYLSQTLWPVDLALIHPMSDVRPWSVIASGATLAVITSMAVVVRRRCPHLLIGWLWFLGTLVPVIGAVRVGLQPTADRYMYVPMIGLLMMAAWWIPSSLHRRSVIAVFISAIVLLGVLSTACMMQVSRWKDSVTLFTYILSVTERNVIAHNILGGVLRKQGLYEQAKIHLTRALEVNPILLDAHHNMGLLLIATSDNAGAERHFTIALQIDRSDSKTWNNLGLAVANQGRHEEAIGHYRKSIELNADDANAHLNLGKSLLTINDTEQAIAAFTSALSLKPDFAEAHAGLGVAYWTLRRVDDAISSFRTALHVRPDMIEARIALGMGLGSQGKYDEAIEQFEIVLRHNPNHARAQQLLQAARARRGQSQ